MNSDFTSSYVSDTDLLFIKYLIEEPYLISETKIRIEHLSDVLAKVIFQMMMKCLAEKNAFLPSIDLTPLFDDKDRLEKYSRFNHPIELTNIDSLLLKFREMSTTESFKNIEQTIIESYNRSQLKILGKSLIMESNDSSKSAKELLRRYGFRIDTLLDKSSNTRVTISSSDVLAMERKHLSQTESDPYPTTGSIIDLVNEGINAPSLTMFLAAPKNLKSTSLYNSCIHSLKLGRTCVFATVEVNAEETTRKLLSIYTGTPFLNVNKRKMTDQQKEEYLRKVEEFSELTKDKLFVLDDQEGLSTKDIIVFVKHLKRAGIEIEDIFIDYLQLLKPIDPKQTRVDFLSLASQELRKMSQNLNARVFSAQQLHSHSSDKDFEDVTYGDVYYCKTLAQDATYAMVNRLVYDENLKKKVLMQRFLESRQLWDDRVYYYPDYNQSTLSLGDPAPYENQSGGQSSVDAYVDDWMKEQLGNIDWDEAV